VTGVGPAVDDADCAVLGIENLSGRRLIGGVPIHGMVTVTPLRRGSARGLRVELVMEELVPARADEPLEEDRGEATIVVAESLAGHVELVPGEIGRYPFTIREPERVPAPSMSTPEFTVRWVLRATLDRPLRADPVTTVELWATTVP
jgi:hypothetical protein